MMAQPQHVAFVRRQVRKVSQLAIISFFSNFNTFIFPKLLFATVGLQVFHSALHLPAVKTILRKRSIIFTGPLMWNQLNPDFHILPSLALSLIHI